MKKEVTQELKKQELKVEEHIRPLKNQVLIEIIMSDQTESGIKLLDNSKELNKEMFPKVICVSSEIEDVKVGDYLVVRPGLDCPYTQIFDRTFCYINSYDILAIVTNEFVEEELKWRRHKNNINKIIKPINSTDIKHLIN